MAYLFDTDAISEIWKPRPNERYLEWLGKIGQQEQCTSAVVIGELFKGAYRSPRRARFLEIIEDHVLPKFTVLDYDTDVAREYGRVRAELELSGKVVAEPDLQIAATALRYGLTVVTRNLKHFDRVPGLRVSRILAEPQR